MSVQDSLDNAVDSVINEMTAENIDTIKKPEMFAYEKYIERYGYAAKNASDLVAFAKKEGIDGVTYSKCKIIVSLMKSEETQSMPFSRLQFPKDESIGGISSSSPDDTLKNKQEKNENKDDKRMIETKLDELSDNDYNKNKDKDKQQEQKNMEEDKKRYDEDDNSIVNTIKSLR